MAVLNGFLVQISNFLRAKDGQSIRDWLKVEPPLPQSYEDLSKELRASYKDNSALESYIEKLIPENNSGNPDEGDVWPGFIAFMRDYLVFWRDINFDDLLGAHRSLSTLVKLVQSTNRHRTWLNEVQLM